MLAFACVLLFSAVIQVISAQGPPDLPADVPEECRRPPFTTERPEDCCSIPPFFSEEDLKECGFNKGGPRPGGPPGCAKQICMLKKYKLVDENEALDTEAINAFLDKYAEDNPVFKPAIDVAKEKCGGKDLPGPPFECDANKFVFCFSHTLFSECPVWAEKEGCKKMKEHFELCKKYFPK